MAQTLHSKLWTLNPKPGTQPLHSEWESAVRELGLGEGVSIIGRSKGSVRLLGRDHVIESIPVRGKVLLYEQVRGHELVVLANLSTSA